MNRSVIIDPALRGQAGHHLNLSIEGSKAAQSIGHKAIILGHKDLNPDLIAGIAQFIPTFSSTSYQHQIGILGRTLRRFVGNRRFLRSTFRERPWEVRLRSKFPAPVLYGDRCAEFVKTLSRLNLSAGDFLIAHSADPQTLDMINVWAARQPRESLPRIGVRTCWSDSSIPFRDYAGGLLPGLLRLTSIAGRVTLTAETPKGAHSIATKTGLAIGVCPYIVDHNLFQFPDRSCASEILVVGWLGDPRPEKGASILPDIIREALKSPARRKIKFVLQSGGRNSRKSREFSLRLAEFGHSAEQIPVALAQTDYFAALNRCDIILLPYDSARYPPERGSGIAVEALLSGKPIIATDQTFAAGLISTNNGVIGNNAATFAAGITQIANDYESFRDGALRARNQALKTYNSIDSYHQLIGMKRYDPAQSDIERRPAVIETTMSGAMQGAQYWTHNPIPLDN